MESGFGARDITALVFIGVAITAIWLYFRHMQRLTEGKSEPDQKPPPK